MESDSPPIDASNIRLQHNQSLEPTPREARMDYGARLRCGSA
jgi:hypothetical protein